MTAIDEVRITAYALGEVDDPAERSRIESYLAANDAAQAEVGGIRELAAKLIDEFAAETWSERDDQTAESAHPSKRPKATPNPPVLQDARQRLLSALQSRQGSAAGCADSMADLLLKHQFQTVHCFKAPILSMDLPRMSAGPQPSASPSGHLPVDRPGERYAQFDENPFHEVLKLPLSTFGLDVDTASYSNVRRFLEAGRLPPRPAVRIEELINYFPYGYPGPGADSPHPFGVMIETAECPWMPAHRLLSIGLKTTDLLPAERPNANLVFLLDVSGSMVAMNKLPLVKRSMKMLTHQLNERDTVSIVVYSSTSSVHLPRTNGANWNAILGAIDQLRASGSTNGSDGLRLAYEQARSGFQKDGINRVILCSDGDFNVGLTSRDELMQLIETQAKSGVFLTVLGFGMGNLKDATLEMLANKGNGHYAYIDTELEATKVLVEQMNSTLVTIAKDVKVQVEFNPAVARSYRLIGYENRMLAKQDFNDDSKDAGEIGAGHTVTALYEIVPAGIAAPTSQPAVDELKYQPAAKPEAVPAPATQPNTSGELLTLKLRYKAPDGDKSTLMEVPVTDDGKSFAQASADFKFVAAVAGFGMILRDSPHKGNATLRAVREWSGEGIGEDKSGYRVAFVNLVKQAETIRGNGTR